MLNKKTLIGFAGTALSTCILAASANAAVDGFYLGGQLGWGDVHQNGISNGTLNSITDAFLAFPPVAVTSASNSSKDTGLAGRLYAGYQFNCNWAGEFGWSKFSNMNTNASLTGFDAVGGAVSSNASGTVKTNALDLVAKGILPLQNNFSLYGKLGVAYIMQEADVSIAVNETAGTSFSASGSQNQNKFYPTFGLGASYDFTPNVAADLSWNRIQKVGSSSNIASTDLVSVGLAYHFG